MVEKILTFLAGLIVIVLISAILVNGIEIKWFERWGCHVIRSMAENISTCKLSNESSIKENKAIFIVTTR